MTTARDEKVAAIKRWLGSGSINIFGLPYAGKDTHGRELAELLGGALLGGGDILRNSTIPDHVRDIMHQGQLVPTEDYINIVLPYLSDDTFIGKPLILSSVGRWSGEEAGVMRATEESGHPLRAVIHLDIDSTTVMDRFARAKEAGDRETRTDDADGVLHRRLDEYRNKTIPVLDYYRAQKILIEIDGLPPKEDVLDAIIDELYRLSLDQG